MRVGRPNLGKTATIKERRIDVYLPTLEVKEGWRAAATKRGQKVSEMVFEIVQLDLAPAKAPKEAEGRHLARQVADLQAELAAARARIEDLTLLREKMDRDLEEYRSQAILGTPPLPNVGSRLVQAFQTARTSTGKARSVDEAELRRVLKIQPRDMERMRALRVGLEALELHGMIRKQGQGWCWNE